MAVAALPGVPAVPVLGGLPPSRIEASPSGDKYKIPFCCECLPDIRIGLYHELKSRFSTQEQRVSLQTNEVAIKALREIQWDADVKSFFTKPIILILIGCLAFAIGLLLPHLAMLAAGTAAFSVLFAAAFFISLVAAGTFPVYTMEIISHTLIDESLPELSGGYRKLSGNCQRYIDALEANPDFHIQLPTFLLPEIPT